MQQTEMLQLTQEELLLPELESQATELAIQKFEELLSAEIANLTESEALLDEGGLHQKRKNFLLQRFVERKKSEYILDVEHLEFAIYNQKNTGEKFPLVRYLNLTLISLADLFSF